MRDEARMRQVPGGRQRRTSLEQLEQAESRLRDLACLAHAIDADVIPRLAQRFRAAGEGGAEPQGPRPTPIDVDRFLQLVLGGRNADADLLISRLRQGGCSVEEVYLELLRPAASRIGELWCEDEVDFAQATLAAGRLQRVLRELSPAFSAEVAAPPHSHRALFVQAAGEQHSFGLSMLAEFFRRAGWDVLGGVGAATADPLERVRREWIDLVGISVGSSTRLPWVQRFIEDVRASSLNRALVVMVGGPLFAAQPELLAGLAADGSAADARQALELAESLVAERQAPGPGGAAARRRTAADGRRPGRGGAGRER